MKETNHEKTLARLGQPGAWPIVASSALGFSSAVSLMWNAVIAGDFVVVPAGWAIIPPQGASQGPAKHA